MAAPTYVPGQVLTADDCNNWFTPDVAVKTADQAITSSITLVNDSQLFLNVAANAAYKFEMFLDYEGGTQGSSDLKLQFSVPTTATMRYHALYLSTGGTVQVGVVHPGADVISVGTGGAGNLRSITMNGSVLNNTGTPVAGTLNFKWCQNTSSATSTIIHAQSYMMLTRIG